MDVSIDETIRGEPPLLAAIDQANKILEMEMGNSAELVKVHWSLLPDDRQRKLLGLRISDWTGSVEARFGLDEFANRRQLQGRLRWLWGDLLQIRSHEQ